MITAIITIMDITTITTVRQPRRGLFLGGAWAGQRYWCCSP